MTILLYVDRDPQEQSWPADHTTEVLSAIEMRKTA